MRMLTRGQLRVNLDVAGTEDPLEDFSRTANRLTMSIIVAGLFIGSSVVYYARIQPVIFGIPVIGFVGYIVAFLLESGSPATSSATPSATAGSGRPLCPARSLDLTLCDIYDISGTHRCRKLKAHLCRHS